MLWFFERDDQSLRLETRYENETAHIVVIIHWPDGRLQTERFADLDACRTWLLAFDQVIAAERWTTKGPIVLPYGWPNKPLT